MGPWGLSRDWADPSVDFVIADGPSPARWGGLRGMAEGFGGWLTAWEDFRVEMYDFREIDHERVLSSAGLPDVARQADWTSARWERTERDCFTCATGK